MNKKGFDMTLKEILMFLLAAACIVFLIILATQVFNLFLTKNSVEQAKSSLSTIVNKLSSLKEGESLKFIYTAPLKWSLLNFSSWNRPNECLGTYCLCLCEKTTVDSCNSMGTCISPSKPVLLAIQNQEASSIKFDKISDLDLKLNQGVFGINLD